MITLSNISKTYPGSSTPIVRNISLTIQDTANTPPLQLRRSIGYVSQDIGLFPHMTVARNVEIAPRLLGWPTAKRRDCTRDLLETVGPPPDTYTTRTFTHHS